MLSLMLSLPFFPFFTIDCFDFGQRKMVWQWWKYKWSEKGSKNANFRSFTVGLHSRRWNVWDHWMMLCSKMLSEKGKPASSWSSSSYLCPSCDTYYPHILKLCVFSPCMLFASYIVGKTSLLSVLSLTMVLLMTASLAGSVGDVCTPAVTLWCVFRAPVSLCWLKETAPDHVASGRRWGSPQH